MADAPKYHVWLDFNGTLVKHARGAPLWDAKGELIIGPPVRPMIDRVRRHMARGRTFVIKSALVWSGAPKDKRDKARAAIEGWCEKWLGKRMEVTAECRPEFIDTWDDKCRQVVRNEGRFADETTGEGDEDTSGTGRDDARAGGQVVRGRSPKEPRAIRDAGDSLRQRATEAFGEWGTWEGDHD